MMLAHTAAFEIEILPPKIVHQSEMRQSSLDIQHRGTVAIRNVCVIARWLTVKLVLLQLFCHVIAVCVCVFVRCMKCYTHTHTVVFYLFLLSARSTIVPLRSHVYMYNSWCCTLFQFIHFASPILFTNNFLSTTAIAKSNMRTNMWKCQPHKWWTV